MAESIVEYVDETRMDAVTGGVAIEVVAVLE
jgi:hypothetical protein